LRGQQESEKRKRHHKKNKEKDAKTSRSEKEDLGRRGIRNSRKWIRNAIGGKKAAGAVH